MAENFTDETGDKPVSWWYFEEESTPALDGNTTNNNDLAWATTTNRNADHVQGSFSYEVPEQAADNPASTFANLSSNFPFKGATTAFTIGGWAYIPNTLVGALLANFWQAGTSGWFFHKNDSNGARVEVIAPVTGSYIPGDSDLTTPAWHHFILRWNGDNRSGAGADDELSFWVDGVKQSTTQTQTSFVLNTTATFEFRGHASSAFKYDEWFVFDVALLDTQIADIYNYRLDGSAQPFRLMFRGS